MAFDDAGATRYRRICRVQVRASALWPGLVPFEKRIRMNMSQDTFNKVVTLTLLVFCMGMFFASWLSGKPIDLQSFLILIAPILTHSIHLITNKVTDRVATIQPTQKNGIIASVPPQP
jgi:hypothetical protein